MKHLLLLLALLYVSQKALTQAKGSFEKDVERYARQPGFGMMSSVQDLVRYKGYVDAKDKLYREAQELLSKL